MRVLEALGQGQEVYLIVLEPAGPILFTLLPYLQAMAFLRLAAAHPLSQSLLEDEIWQQCVLEHPYDSLDATKAGVVSTVANLILYLSVRPELEKKRELQEECRQLLAQDLFLQLQTAICKTFPGIHPRELRSLTLKELLVLLAQVEMISGQKLDLGEEKKSSTSASRPPSLDFQAINESRKRI